MSAAEVEAAKRGVGQHHWWLTRMDDDLMVSVVEYATDSAREALKPIRDCVRLRDRGLLTDKEFADVVSAAVRVSEVSS